MGCLKHCWGSCPSHQRGAALQCGTEGCHVLCGALLRNPHGIPPWNKAVCSGSRADSKWPHCSSHDTKNKRKKAVSAWKARAIPPPRFCPQGRCCGPAQACISFPSCLRVPTADCTEMSKPSTSLCRSGVGLGSTGTCWLSRMVWRCVTPSALCWCCCSCHLPLVHGHEKQDWCIQDELPCPCTQTGDGWLENTPTASATGISPASEARESLRICQWQKGFMVIRRGQSRAAPEYPSCPVPALETFP